MHVLKEDAKHQVILDEKNNKKHQFKKDQKSNSQQQLTTNIQIAKPFNTQENFIEYNVNDLSEIAEFIDDETKELLYNHNQNKVHSLMNYENDKKEEIVKKLVESNQKFQKNGKKLKVTKDDIKVIKDSGLDSISILYEVINQFSYLFKESQSPRLQRKIKKINDDTQKKKKVQTKSNHLK